MEDRRTWLTFSVPAFLAAATCPIVETTQSQMTVLVFWLIALGSAYGGNIIEPILDKWSRRTLLFGSAAVLISWPQHPLILALTITWIIGLLSQGRTINGFRSNALNLVSGLGLLLVVVTGAWQWYRAKGLAVGIDLTTRLVAAILQLSGASVWVDQDSLWVGTAATNSILVTPEALGLPYILLWASAVSAMLLWYGYSPSTRFWLASLLFVCIGLGSFVIRARAVVDGYWPVEVLSLTAWQLCWLVPIGAGLSIWILQQDSLKPVAEIRYPRGVVLAMLFAAGITVFSLSMPYSSSYQPLRILIDDGHGPWESTKIPVNIESYGRLSLYNYTLLRQWLEIHHAVEVTDDNTSLPKDLEKYHVLILKTPAKDYSSEEIEQVRTFVMHGGGLLLIGDHTNLFGHVQRLNAMAAPYGVTFRIDATFPWTDRVPTYIHQPSRSLGIDRPLNGLGPFAVLTAASVTDSSLWGMPIILSTSIISEAADYSNMNFFGPLRLSADDRVTPLALAIAKPYGSGKVVAWGESTMWSSFSLFHPEYPEVILRLLGYLGTPSIHFQSQIMTILALLILLGLAAWLLQHSGSLLMLRALLVSVPLGGLLGASFSFQAPWPDVSQRVPSTMKSLAVDIQHSKASLRIDATRHSMEEENVYSAFYAWLGRLQVWPFPVKHWDPLLSTRPLLILNPVMHYTEKEIGAIGNFVRAGGTLCVVDDGMRSADSTAQEVLIQFGLQYRLQSEPRSLYPPNDGMERWLEAGLALSPLTLGLDISGEVRPALLPSHERLSSQVSIIGGTPLAVTENGDVVWARKTFGQGTVIVFTNSQAFNQLSLGDIWGSTDPGASRHRLYRLEHDLIREIWARD